MGESAIRFLSWTFPMRIGLRRCENSLAGLPGTSLTGVCGSFFVAALASMRTVPSLVRASATRGNLVRTCFDPAQHSQ